MPARLHLLTLASLLLAGVAAHAADEASPRVPALDDAAAAAFTADAVREHGLQASAIEARLADARYQQSIIDAITRPAEAKPWHAYRQIFMTDKRIADGRAFLAKHRAALSKVERDSGVPAALVVAILGVETSYGSITGSYRVLDALYTLGFHYPPRQDFFRRELAQFLVLAGEEPVDPATTKGSYAGAMGWGQFMPSSYRAYAVDGDGDGRRDLFNSLPDVFASVANYFVAHGWQPGQPVAVRARRDTGAEPFDPESSETRYDLASLGERGYRPVQALGQDLPATLLTLDGGQAPEHWITFRNFYAITRYNRSPLYAMAVYQLAQAIADGDAAASAALSGASAAEATEQ